MATKTKGTNAKIKELKGVKPEKISTFQLEKMQSLFNNLNRSQIEIGGIELRKHDLMHNLSTLKEDLTTLQTDFEKEYGTFDVNIQDGTINYPEDGEVNKED